MFKLSRNKRLVLLVFDGGGGGGGGGAWLLYLKDHIYIRTPFKGNFLKVVVTRFLFSMKD